MESALPILCYNFAMHKPIIIAHRGDSSRALENSLAAFKLALAVPVDMIEFDLRMSRDEALFVMHDKHTGRSADMNIDIEQAASEEICRVRLKNGEAIPSLDDALGLIGGKVGINIEVKSDGAGAVLARRLLHSQYSGEVMVSSFKEDEVRAVRGVMPELPLAVIYDAFSAHHVAGYRSKGYQRISLRKTIVSEALINACHEQGICIYVWTVDDEEEMKRFIAWGADGIYSNKPLVLSELVRQRASGVRNAER